MDTKDNKPAEDGRPHGRLRQSFLFVGLFFSFYFAFSLQSRENPRVSKDGRYILDLDFFMNRSRTPAAFSFIEAVLGLLPSSFFALDATSVQDAAKHQCGTGEFWNHPYGKAAFEAYTSALQIDNPPLTLLGRYMLRENIVNWLCAQMQLNRLLKEHPEINDEPIRAVVIAGAPRTGSTHMMSMLCQHPNATCLTFAESLAPIAPVKGPDILGWKDWRLYHSSVASLIIVTLRPLFKYMFKFGATQPMEELQLGALAFGSTIFLTQAYLPTYNRWFMETDHTPMEEYVKLFLKLIQFQRGGERKLWILKSPQNANQLGPKTRVYPASSVVLMHREALPVIQSMIGMVCYTVGIFCHVDKIDYKGLARLWLHHQVWSQVESLSPSNVAKHVQPISKLKNVRFGDFMDDPVGVALSVAKHAGLSDNDHVRSVFESFQKNSPRDGSNVLKYDIESLGIRESQVREMFAPYEKEYLTD